MASTATMTPSEPDEQSRPKFSLASQPPYVAQIPTIEALEPYPSVDQSSISPAASLHLEESSTQYLLPIPASSSAPPRVFSLSDLFDESGGLESLGPEIASADITIAADGSFIETSSGPAARELKRRYDHLVGVGPSVRTPYAITAFVSQHGKPMYRISHRDEHSAPAASSVDVEERLSMSKSSNDSSQSPRTKRRSRLSMHFLPQFTKNNVTPSVRPPTASSATSSVSRKLRRTKSIPDMFTTCNGEPASVTVPGPTVPAPGRAHSQSVTAMDVPRQPIPFHLFPAPRNLDVFAEILEWSTLPLSASSNISASNLFTAGKGVVPQPQEALQIRPTISQPFGPAVTFTSPSHKPYQVSHLPTSRHLREMQSFESGLTARQGSRTPDLPSSDSPVPSELSSEQEISRPPSAIRLSVASTALLSTTTEEAPSIDPEPDFTLSPESLRLSSHYSTEVFNVLQTYRGLPMFEKLVTDNDVIRLSLAADQSAAPRDDPRFVIWGETVPDQDADDYHSTSRDSLTDLSSLGTSSKRRSSKLPKLKTSEASTSRLPAPEGQKVLLAATIERWIAQLTSDLNYNELLNFFLTYRTYVSAVDLCHLLICRFHWALQQPSSKEDESVRRVVRVRTFVAIRYWLLTFFTVDFIPNLELRLLIADWLNTLLHDPVLKGRSDGIGIVRRLVKVAKECKRAHTSITDKPKVTSPPKRASTRQDKPADHVLGKSFAQAIKKQLEDEESDLEFDFLPADAKGQGLTSGFHSDPANAHLAVGHAAGGAAFSSSKPASLPLSSFNVSQRMDHFPGPTNDSEASLVKNSVQIPLPARHSAISRAFVRTIGRLGRWRRVLHPRSLAQPIPLGACGAGVSAFDLEISASRDLLTVNGGVEQYLKMMEPISSATKTPQLSNTPAKATAPPLPPPSNITVWHPPISSVQAVPSPVPHSALSESRIPHSPILPNPPASQEVSQVGPVESRVDNQLHAPQSTPEEHVKVELIHEEVDVGQGQFVGIVDAFQDLDRPESFRSSSTDSFGEPLASNGPRTFPGTHSQWEFDIVSIDDLDFSDTSSIPAHDLPHPPGLKRLPKKLPMRRDFEFIRRSQVSSMGYHESMRDSITSSTHSESSPSSSGPQPIHRWQLKSIKQTFENDVDEGDVEAALRRLEGQINPKTREKAEGVDSWLQNINQRMANGEYENSILSEDEVEGFVDEIGTPELESDGTTEDPFSANEEASDQEEACDIVHTPLPSEIAHQVPFPPGLDTPLQATKEAKSAVDDAIPLEILQSRVTSMEVKGKVQQASPVERALSSKFANPDTPRIHRSFVLSYSAEALAEHFAMIDRELFMSIKFEELVTEEWMEVEEINVLDWAQYLKDRTRWKAESRFSEKTTALAAVRARFNLMVNFVVSEIVLTPPAERHIVVAKFIRIAWKSYLLCSHNALTAIITALQRDWVTKAMRKPSWHRVGIFETRMLRDLQQFISNVDDFKFLRQAVDAVDAKPQDASSYASSVVSGGESQSGKGKLASDARPSLVACVPFVGIYLSQLQRYNRLPALIDPTAPNTVIGIDPVTAIFEPLAQPEVFSDLVPLPDSMHLEPLINVHKQRRIAAVITSLVSGQHLASRVQFDVDKKLFQRCLKLRGLDSEYLQRALAMYPD